MTIYLAIPYSFNPYFSNLIVNKVGAKLYHAGHAVFSPISQGHVIADHLPDHLRKDSEWWLKRVLPFVPVCDQLWIVVIGEKGTDLINESVGCKAELELAMRLGKPVVQVEVDSNGEILTILE